MTLNQFCRYSEVNTEIETCAKLVTRICIEGSRFLNLWILHLLENDDEIPQIGHTTINRAFQAMRPGRHSANVIKEFGRALRRYDEGLVHKNYCCSQFYLQHSNIEFCVPFILQCDLITTFLRGIVMLMFPDLLVKLRESI
jgi:hypothetical protein